MFFSYYIARVFVFLFLQSDRLRKVRALVSMVHDLCVVLGMDFFGTITEVDPSLNSSSGPSIQPKSISNQTIAKLSKIIATLKKDKLKRLQKVTSFCLFSSFIKTLCVPLVPLAFFLSLVFSELATTTCIMNL